MAEIQPKHLPDIRLHETDISQDIQSLIGEIKPNWPLKELRFTKLGGGVSCLLFRCYANNQPQESVTVRVWKMFENSPYANHQFEIDVIREAAKHGLFPPLLATFANGYCYAFVPGETMFEASAKEFHLDETVLSGKNMASIHNLQVPDIKENRPGFFQQMLDSLGQVSFPLMRPSPPIQLWKEEVKALEDFLSKQRCQLSICHGDPHPGNIIWTERNDNIMFLDWEFTHIGYGIVDMAYFLYSFEYKEHVFKTKMVYTADFESLFAKYYLLQNFDLKGQKKSSVSDEDINDLVKKIKIFSLGVWLRFIVHHICFPDISRIATNVVEGTLEYFIDRYQAIRKEVMGSSSLGQRHCL